MSAVRTAVMLVVFGLFLAPVSLRAQDEEEIGLAIGAAGPTDVQLEDLEGKPVNLGAYVGKKPVLLEFWATWCPICAALLPRIEAAQKQYGDRVDFVVVAVGVNENPASIKRHLARHPMPFPVLFDRKGAAVRAFEAPQTSYVITLDAGGKVTYTGLGEDQDIDGAVRKALGTPAGKAATKR